jgi:predicted ribosome quality control (RQC) complex YloA/Tae2 family protein
LLDGLTLRAVESELRTRLSGARVQDSIQPDPLGLALETYGHAGRLTLSVSARADRQGVRVDGARARRGSGNPTPLALAAAAHLEGARLVEVRQPPWERLLVFRFARAADPEWTLVCEVMGRLANVVLVDAKGVVRASARTVGPAMSRARTVVAGAPYVPPPAQSRADVHLADAEAVEEWLAACPGPEPAWRAVVRHVAGASPLSSREAVFRAAGDAEAPASAVSPTLLLDALLELFDQASVEPWLAPGAAAYAAYRLTHLGGAPCDSVLDALARYEDAELERDEYRSARGAVEEDLGRATLRVRRKRDQIEHQGSRGAEAAVLRAKGDLILAHMIQIRPGQKLLEAAFDPGAPPIPIELDPALPPAANADAYYRRARRVQRASEGLARRLEQADLDLAYLAQLEYDLAAARTRSQIDAVATALASAGFGAARGRRTRSPAPRGASASAPVRAVTSAGFTIWLGRSAAENEVVTFVKAARGDLWLHARGTPGAHVVVKAAGRPIPEETLLEAAALAAWHSRARMDGRVTVDVVPAERVRRAADGRPGLVTFDSGRTVEVAPRALSSGDDPPTKGDSG